MVSTAAARGEPSHVGEEKPSSSPAPETLTLILGMLEQRRLVTSALILQLPPKDEYYADHLQYGTFRNCETREKTPKALTTRIFTRRHPHFG